MDPDTTLDCGREMMRGLGLGLGVGSAAIASSVSAPSNPNLGRVRRPHPNPPTWLHSTNKASGMEIKWRGQRKMGIWVQFGKCEVIEEDGGI